jgi:hypothetical protein
MENVLRPTSEIILVSIFVCLCLIGQSAATLPGTTDPLYRIKDFHSKFIAHDKNLMPFLIHPHLSYKWMREPGLKPSPPDLMPHSLPMKQHIAMNNSHSVKQVQDMDALNTNMRRDIVFDEVQSSDPVKDGLKNSMNIVINGNGPGQPKSNAWLEGSSDDSIENLVDNAVSSTQHYGPGFYGSQSGSSAQQRLGNYMNIDVSGINVKAVNTVQGGSAVATSNIEIKPVQIITCTPEAEEKLK